MMDIIFNGLFWGGVAPPLGSFLSRFKFSVVIIFGFIVGILFNLVFIVYVVIFNGGFRLFLDGLIGAVERHGYGDLAFQYLFAPAIFIACFGLIRLLSPPPTFEAAINTLESEGYKKCVSNNGRRIEYKKDGAVVIFRIDRRYGPPQAEWWRDGKRKGDILLRDPVYDGG